jgi:hypothetical protein
MWLIGVALAQEDPLRFRWARIDVLSEDPGFWLNDQAPVLLDDPLVGFGEWAQQVKVVLGTPVLGLTVGASIESQSIHYERPIFGFQSVLWGGGLQTSLGLPRGVWVNVAWQQRFFRAALALSTVADISWWDLESRRIRFLPTIGIGFGPG